MKRRSDMELLRVFAMLSIIAGHMIGQSGIIDMAEARGGYLQWAIYILGGGCKNIGQYILADSSMVYG